ncbi:MAG: NAD-dependent epimerase/dehydratase family protein [Microcoleaceae cyanobacterium MO_207.B10]|nr:NAD-dependent epimerase/dehydratase family protein [Microcoleaceae cyanobacterium MO_207.B10]
MKTVVITGISGTLGSAMGKAYKSRGWRVVGVTRQPNLEGDFFEESSSVRDVLIAECLNKIIFN